MRDVDQKLLVSLCPDPVIGVDGSGIVQIFNRAAEKLLGYCADDVIDKTDIRQIYPDLESARKIKSLMFSEEFGEKGSVEGYETFLRDSTGEDIMVRLSAAIIDEKEGSSIGFFHDLTERRRLEEKLHKLSVTDELTGLFNQRHFYKVLATELDRAKRYNHCLSLICFDLDNFKKVNDSLGHLEGDRILRLIGELLKETLRQVDVPVRYGGDEFMVLLPETDIQSAGKLADRIRRTFNSRCPYSAENCDTDFANVSMSLGVTETDGSEKPDQVVQRADLAMYESKTSGGDSTVLIRQRIGDVID